MPNEESVKLGKTREGNNGVGTERNDAFVFISLGEFVGEFEDDEKVLLETDYEDLCLG